ncbi:MAG: hypothetical protein KF791_13770 [Verrucomicrobiae bacterium]|nr:hypothetical protein [Verrucomicrobiae bacterium]
MTSDPVKEFERLRTLVLERKAELEAELRALEAALGGMAVPPASPLVIAAPREPRKRVRNAMSLGDAVFSVTKDAPLTKVEILQALDLLGYQFSDKSSSMEALEALLQLDRRFENTSGRYGPTLEALFPKI